MNEQNEHFNAVFSLFHSKYAQNILLFALLKGFINTNSPFFKKAGKLIQYKNVKFEGIFKLILL